VADPSGIGARVPRAFLTPPLLRVSEAGMEILADAGFPEREAASAWRALWSYTFGFATFALADTPAEARRAARVAIAGLPEDEYPALGAAGGELAEALTSEDEFEYGLDRLLDALGSRLEALAVSSPAAP
jgi:hypothetical protein